MAQQDTSNPFVVNALILGPFMLYAAFRKSLGFNERLLLGSAGAVMVYYNLSRYRAALDEGAQALDAQVNTIGEPAQQPAIMVGARG